MIWVCSSFITLSELISSFYMIKKVFLCCVLFTYSWFWSGIFSFFWQMKQYFLTTEFFLMNSSPICSSNCFYLISHSCYFMKANNPCFNMLMLAVRFTWLERSKLVKLLLWRKLEWTMREKGYFFEHLRWSSHLISFKCITLKSVVLVWVLHPWYTCVLLLHFLAFDLLNSVNQNLKLHSNLFLFL